MRARCWSPRGSILCWYPGSETVRILADENFPGDAAEALREHGPDGAWVRIETLGASDAEVLARAQAESRVLVTFDKDFRELAYRTGVPSSTGIVLFGVSLSSPSQIVRVALAALNSRTDWGGNFAVVQDDRIRMRPLPGEQ